MSYRHLINFGFIRGLTQNLSEFRLYKDSALQSSYDPHYSD